MSNQSLWNKDFLLDTGINFVVYLIYYLLMVIIAVVAKDQLDGHAAVWLRLAEKQIDVIGGHTLAPM